MSFRELGDHPRVTADPEVCGAYAADVSGLRCTPAAVARPECEAEVADILQRCADRRLPVTAQGLRSSTTGASVATSGIALSLERMKRIIEIDPERRIAIAEPGIVTAELKRAIQQAGLFYPPDPTSEEECTLGGNVACNASGSRTYRYGPTRAYVQALRVVLADGSVVTARRVAAAKNAAGYFGFQNPIDLWIGSEGTLGLVTRIELRLLDRPAGFFGALAFFRDWRAAIRFVLAADGARQTGDLQPRCLELFDRDALAIIRPLTRKGSIPEDARAAIFFEEEVRPAAADAALERWFAAIDAAGGLAGETLIARTAESQADLRRLRHAVPSEMQERGTRAVARGGRRVSTDFAVPLPRLPELMSDAYRIMRELFGGATVAYGHVGSGHPHFNLLATDARELQRALDAARAMTRRALDLGGTMVAEHGIGKLKAGLYRELHPPWLWSAMRAVKTSLDPKGILAPGNLFA